MKTTIKNTKKRCSLGTAAKALATSAVLVGSLMTSNAAIVAVSGLPIQDADPSSTNLDVDIDGSGTLDFELNFQANKNTIISGSGFAFVTTGNKANSPPSILSNGITVSATSNFNTFGIPLFNSNTSNGRYGFRFSSGGATRFGWMELSLSSSAFTVNQIVYDDSGASINVGQLASVPEPSSTVLTLLGGLLGLSYRKRK